MDKKFLCNWTTMTKFVCATKLFGNIEPQSKCTTLKNVWNSFRHPSAFETSYRNKEHEDVLDNAFYELRGPLKHSKTCFIVAFVVDAAQGRRQNRAFILCPTIQVCFTKSPLWYFTQHLSLWNLQIGWDIGVWLVELRFCGLLNFVGFAALNSASVEKIQDSTSSTQWYFFLVCSSLGWILMLIFLVCQSHFSEGFSSW